jgi:hypothetical protein
MYSSVYVIASSARRFLLGALLGTALTLAPIAAANARELEEVNPELAAQLQLKVLAYDRSLLARAEGQLVLAILYRTDREESERSRAAMQAAFQRCARQPSLQGLHLSVVAVALGFDPKMLTKRLREVGARALYVTPGLEDAAGDISESARALHTPTLTGVRSLLDAGMAVAVVLKEDRPAIVIDLKVAKALGMNFDSMLLRLAEVKQ